MRGWRGAEEQPAGYESNKTYDAKKSGARVVKYAGTV
jgi:hypothetical protein